MSQEAKIENFSEGEEAFLPFSKPCISDAAIQDVVTCLKSGWLATGPFVQKFEEDLCTYLESPHAHSLASATAGLFFAVQALDLQPGDEVITTPLTFVATANAIAVRGARPVFVDIEPSTRNLDVTLVKAAITERTKAIMPVHFAGLPVDLDPLYALARDHNLTVIEDAAHAIGTHYKGRKIGSFGDVQIFSFYANKTMTTGEGGCLTTRSDSFAEKVRLLRFHGISQTAWDRFTKKGSQHYDVIQVGYKANMMDLQGALGIHQLRAVDGFIEKRTHLAERYSELLSCYKMLRLPAKPAYDHKHSWHLYTVVLDSAQAGLSRDQLIAALKEHNIGTGLHYNPVHLFPYYRDTFGYKEGDFPRAEQVGANILSLPLFPEMTLREQDRVISALQKILKN